MTDEENNPYLADLRNPDPIYQLRACTHDVVKSSSDPWSEAFSADVDDLLSLCRNIMREHNIEPEEYADQYDRGGEPLEEED